MPISKRTGERKMVPLTGCTYGWDEDEPIAIIYDARYVPRATAISCHATVYGIGFAEVACRTSYVRWLTSGEVWDEGPAKDRWVDRQLDAYFTGVNDPAYRDGSWWLPDGTKIELRDPPADPPEGWEPGEADPAWQYCKRDDDGAIKVYVCEVA